MDLIWRTVAHIRERAAQTFGRRPAPDDNEYPITRPKHTLDRSGLRRRAWLARIFSRHESDNPTSHVVAIPNNPNAHANTTDDPRRVTIAVNANVNPTSNQVTGNFVSVASNSTNYTSNQVTGNFVSIAGNSTNYTSNYTMYNFNMLDKAEHSIFDALHERYVPQAVYYAQPTSGCTEGTRVQILRNIKDWIMDPSASPILWLTGSPGSGKTAIAWTVCSLANNDIEIVLGGSFFCSRMAGSVAQSDVRSIVPTLAQLLAVQSNEFSEALANELARDPDITQKQVGIQVNRLLIKPLRELRNYPVPILFVIDALDECGAQSSTEGVSDDAETYRVIAELSSALAAVSHRSLKSRMRFFISGRPEPIIRDTITASSDLSRVLNLDIVEQSHLEADIRLYTRVEFSKVTFLQQDVLDNAAKILTRLCEGLFIFAAIATQYMLGEAGEGDVTRFEQLTGGSLDGLVAYIVASVDPTFTQIMHTALAAKRMDAPPDLRCLLASVVSTRVPLSIAAIADLLNVSGDELCAGLSPLHSVVHVVDSDTELGLRPLHSFFRDYLFARAPWHIRVSKDTGHDILARACLRVIANDLPIDGSSTQAEPAPALESIKMALEYACLHWVFHVSHLPRTLRLEEKISDVFRPRLMSWLNLMCALRSVETATEMLELATQMVQSPALSKLFRDASPLAMSVNHERQKEQIPQKILEDTDVL